MLILNIIMFDRLSPLGKNLFKVSDKKKEKLHRNCSIVFTVEFEQVFGHRKMCNTLSKLLLIFREL